MTLNDFLSEFDKQGSVVLLEGKRNVAEEDIPKLTALGSLLAENSSFMTFRSGNANGADEYFSMGVAAINPDKLESVTPYGGHRKTKILTKNIIALDDLNMQDETELITQSCANKKMAEQVKQYANGNITKISIKAAYIIRDTLKVIGASGISPASFGIFYDDLEKPISGGTGHTIKTCRVNNIQEINQTVWFNWL